MAATISTHVLDVSRGRPAAGVAVELHAPRPGGGWEAIAATVTDDDGRAGPLDAGAGPGPRRLVFATGEHWSARGVAGFFPEVAVTFDAPAEENCHVPLLLSPFGYSTYRGS